MRKPLFRIIAGLAAALTLLAGPAARAADLALIASGGKSGARPGLAEDLIDAYTDAGYQVIDGRGADRAALIGLLEDFEFDGIGADRLVIHLIGPLAESGGLPVYLPRGATGSSLTEIMAEGLPLQLFLDLVDQGEGKGMLALSITNFREQPAAGLRAPPGVLLMRGFPTAVNAVVVDQMLRNRRSAGEIDTRALSVEVEGQVTNSFRLVGARERTPAEREEELGLGREERMQVQKDLRLLGFEPGPADGAMGENTRDAIFAWQGENGFPRTGYLTAAQVEEIGRSAGKTRDEIRAATTTLRAEQTAWEVARQENTKDAYEAFLADYPDGRYADEARGNIAELDRKIERARRLLAAREAEDALELPLASGAVIERRLERLGYDTGAPDGRFDRQTRRALEAFQESRGLEPSGYVDTPTLQQLILAGAAD